jgi:hypothetical protein
MVIGLVSDVNIANGANGSIMIGGIFIATTAQWDAVTGDIGGLVTGSRYYLSAATAGLLTATPPSTIGQYIEPIGYALNTTHLKISIEPYIKL